MTKKDIKIINAIINHIALSTELEDEFGRYATTEYMTEDQFHDWIAKVDLTKLEIDI